MIDNAGIIRAARLISLFGESLARARDGPAGTPKAQVPPGNAQAHERQAAKTPISGRQGSSCGLWRVVDLD
jgi:hypothetical protein